MSCSPVADVVKEIEEFDGLQALRLEGNTLGVEAAQAIAKALETKSELKVPGWTLGHVLNWNPAVKSTLTLAGPERWQRMKGRRRVKDLLRLLYCF